MSKAASFNPFGEVVGAVDQLTRGSQGSVREDDQTMFREETPPPFQPLGEAAGDVNEVTRGFVTGNPEGSQDSFWKKRGEAALPFEPLPPLPGTAARLGDLSIRQ